MNSRFVAWVVGAAALMMTAVAGVFPSSSVQTVPAPVARGAGDTCWVLMDFDGFSCGLCLDALVDFCRALPPSVQERRVRGILAYRAPQGKEAAIRQAGIVAKKWSGFRKANDIRFPVFIDAGRLFASGLGSGPAVLLFDENAGTLRMYPLPLHPAQLENILAILRK
jgi:hypothetical protein